MINELDNDGLLDSIYYNLSFNIVWSIYSIVYILLKLSIDYYK